MTDDHARRSWAPATAADSSIERVRYGHIAVFMLSYEQSCAVHSACRSCRSVHVSRTAACTILQNANGYIPCHDFTSSVLFFFSKPSSANTPNAFRTPRSVHGSRVISHHSRTVSRAPSVRDSSRKTRRSSVSERKTDAVRSVSSSVIRNDRRVVDDRKSPTSTGRIRRVRFTSPQQYFRHVRTLISSIRTSVARSIDRLYMPEPS